MEGIEAQIGLEWPKFVGIRRFFAKRPVNISKVLALYEAKKRMDQLHLELNERLNFSRML